MSESKSAKFDDQDPTLPLKRQIIAGIDAIVANIPSIHGLRQHHLPVGKDADGNGVSLFVRRIDAFDIPEDCGGGTSDPLYAVGIKREYGAQSDGTFSVLEDEFTNVAGSMDWLPESRVISYDAETGERAADPAKLGLTLDERLNKIADALDMDRLTGGPEFTLSDAQNALGLVALILSSEA